MSAFVIIGVLSGMVIGLIDTLDTVLGGFTGSMSVADILGFVLVGVTVHAAFGAAMGLATGAGAAIARRKGAAFDGEHGFRLGRIALSPRAVLAAVGLASALVLCAAIWWFLGGYPFGFGAVEVLAVTGTGCLGVLAIGLALARSSRLAVSALWLLIAAALWYVEARLIYQFSRQGNIPIVHTVGLFGLYWFAFVAVAAQAPGLWRAAARAARPVTIGVGVAAVLLLCAARPLLALGTNQLRLALHERTSLTYRLLELLPASGHDPREAFEDAECGPGSVAASTDSLAPEPDSSRPVRGVVLVMIDSLRADHLSAEITPNLARLSAESTSFSRAYTPSPSTYLAMRTMMSGRFMSRDIEDTYDDSSLGPLLKRDGIRTIAVAAHENLWYAVSMFDVYDQFDEDISNRSSLTSQDTVAHAAKQLDALGPDDEFFLLAHFYDPHAHYVGNHMFESGGGEDERYDAEVAYTDYWIGELLTDLDQRGLRDEVAVLIVSDHGDEFWEHRYMRHLLRLYDESVRVAMVMRVPGAAPRRVTMPVSIMDIAPTVLDLFGHEPPDTMIGHTLVPVALGHADPRDRPLYLRSYYDRTAAIVRGEKKLIYSRATGVTEYYDLAKDPFEQDNLADTHAGEFGDMYCSLMGWLAAEDSAHGIETAVH